MTRKHIVIGIPSFGVTSIRWAAAYRQLATPMNGRCFTNLKQGLEVGIARNMIIADTLAMDPRPSHIFFLDDDVIPPTPFPLLQLLKADLPIVSGVYFAKHEFGEPIAFLEPECGTLKYVPGSGIHPVNICGMGLCLIRTEVFQEMVDECDLGLDERGNPRWCLTRGDIPGEPTHTEDSWFFEHAKTLGYVPHVDTSPYCFAWHYDLELHAGFPSAQWKEFLKTGTASWEVPNGDA